MRKITKTKAAAAALMLAMTLLLTACGHEHVWYAATCTAPKTCSECGETEGETLPHIWEDATCTTPKKCSVCGGTEGEALPHTWQEANYQSPATCSVCGETEGDVLTPDFVTYNIPLAELGVTYDFVLPCSTDETKTTVAHVTVSDYRVFELDDTHPAKEGYEYRQAELTFVLDDDNANRYGARGYMDVRENYYDADDDTSFIKATEEGRTYAINYNGQEQEYTWFYPERIRGEWEGDTGEKALTDKHIYTVLVPAGYDGIVVGLYNSSTVSYDKGLHLNDVYEEGKFVLFRMA